MNRQTRNIVKVIVIVVATAFCGLLAYFISNAITGHQLATMSGNMNYTEWQSKFLKIVIANGVFTGILSIIWLILSAKVFTINSTVGVGRRSNWLTLAVVSLFGNLAIANLYSNVLRIQINVMVMILFVVFFTVIGYWLVSIFTTAGAFKYTPVGAQLFLNRK